MTVSQPGIKMAAINQKYVGKRNISASIHDSNGHTHIFEVEKHDGTNVNTVRCRGNLKSKMAAITGSRYEIT